MARLRYNGIRTTLGASLSSGGTTVTFAAGLEHSGGTNVPTLTGSDYIPLAIIDDASGDLEEIVHLTAYTAGATTGTISRGQEGTPGVAHDTGDIVICAPMVLDLTAPVEELVTVLDADATTTRPQRGLAAWYAALGNRATAAAKVLLIGDSIFEGTGASAWANRGVIKLEDMLRAAHPVAGVAGGVGYVPSVTAFAPDPPVTLTVGSGTITEFMTQNSAGSLGIKSLGLKGNGGAGTGSRATWGPHYCDRVRVWYTQPDSFAADGTVFIDGVSTATLTGSNPAQWRGGQVWNSDPLTPGNHTVEIRGGDGLDFLVDAVEFFDGDYAKGVHVYDGAHFGLATTDWIGAGANRGVWKAVETLAPQLVVVNLGTNDEDNAVTAATYLANIDTILASIDTAITGDYSVLLVANYTPSRAIGNAAWADYRAGLLARTSHKVAVLDLDALWPVLAADGSRNAGLMSEATDPLHPNNAGHEYLARILARAVSAWSEDATLDASATVKGVVELATTTEAAAGTDTTRAVTPAGLAAGVPALLPARLAEGAAASGTGDANTAVTSGFYYLWTPATNGPGAEGFLTVTAHSTDYVGQTLIAIDSAQMWFRRRNAGTWSAWTAVT